MLALDMRLQLSQPDMNRMGPQLYNEAFSLHGSTMLFLVSIPAMEAMAIWLVPLMLGQCSLAFSRLAAFSYWLYLGRRRDAVGAARARHHARSRLVRVSAAVRPLPTRPGTALTSGRR